MKHKTAKMIHLLCISGILLGLAGGASISAQKIPQKKPRGSKTAPLMAAADNNDKISEQSQQSSGDSESQSNIDKWKKHGGLLWGYAAAATGVYMKIDLPSNLPALGSGSTTSARIEGMGYGGNIEIPFLYVYNAKRSFLNHLGISAVTGVQGGQATLSFEDDKLKATGFYANYEFPVRAGLYFNVVTFDPDSIFSFLGTGIGITGYYRRTYNFSQLKVKAQQKTGPLKGQTVWIENNEAKISEHGYGLEIQFASVKADFDRYIQSPNFKLDIFLLPGNPFLVAVNLGIVRYY